MTSSFLHTLLGLLLLGEAAESRVRLPWFQSPPGLCDLVSHRKPLPPLISLFKKWELKYLPHKAVRLSELKGKKSPLVFFPVCRAGWMLASWFTTEMAGIISMCDDVCESAWSI